MKLENEILHLANVRTRARTSAASDLAVAGRLDSAKSATGPPYPPCSLGWQFPPALPGRGPELKVVARDVLAHSRTKHLHLLSYTTPYWHKWPSWRLFDTSPSHQ